MRVYLNGQRVYTSGKVLFAPPYSNISIGASTYGGNGAYGDFYGGAIAQVHAWLGAVTDSIAHAAFVAGIPAYTPVLAVDGVSSKLSLAGLRSNPATGPLDVAFALTTSEAARLELVDVTGRVVRSVEVGGMGPGRHTASLGNGRELAAGVYWVRLRQAGQTLTAKAAIVH
jgi:hypothetical protein